MITITTDQATALRNATRAEEDLRADIELAATKARVRLLTLAQAKRKIWTGIADAHGIDADQQYEFNAAACTLTPKSG